MNDGSCILGPSRVPHQPKRKPSDDGLSTIIFFSYADRTILRVENLYRQVSSYVTTAAASVY